MATLAALEAELAQAKIDFAAEKDPGEFGPTELESRIAELEVLIPHHPENDPNP